MWCLDVTAFAPLGFSKPIDHSGFDARICSGEGTGVYLAHVMRVTWLYEELVVIAARLLLASPSRPVNVRPDASPPAEARAELGPPSFSTPT
jgi:hypothetical protein